MSGFSSRSKGNVLWEHCREWHESREVLFKFEMVRKLFTALTRQVCEAVTIKCNKDDMGMNRKDEWNGAGIPNLVVQVRDKIMEENKETRNRPVRREPPEKDMGLEIEKTKRMRLDEDDKDKVVKDIYKYKSETGEEDGMNDKEGPHDDDILPLDIPKNTKNS